MATLRERVALAVNTTDPMGLLAACAPPDEYDPEIDDLTKHITALLALSQMPVERQTVSSLATLISLVFNEWFWPGCVGQPQAEQIARQILTSELTNAGDPTKSK